MSSVPQYIHRSWWDRAETFTLSIMQDEFDKPKEVIDSLLREIALKGKLTPETIQ